MLIQGKLGLEDWIIRMSFVDPAAENFDLVRSTDLMPSDMVS